MLPTSQQTNAPTLSPTNPPTFPPTNAPAALPTYQPTKGADESSYETTDKCAHESADNRRVHQHCRLQVNERMQSTHTSSHESSEFSTNRVAVAILTTNAPTALKSTDGSADESDECADESTNESPDGIQRWLCPRTNQQPTNESADVTQTNQPTFLSTKVATNVATNPSTMPPTHQSSKFPTGRSSACFATDKQIESSEIHRRMRRRIN
jgi:hypothetical protein